MRNSVVRRDHRIAVSHAVRRNDRAISIFLVLSGAAILSVMASATSSASPATVLAVPTVLGCLLVWRHARPSVKAPISPINVAHALFAVQLVVIPLVAHWSGYSHGQLLRLPSERSIALGLLMQLLGYGAFCASYHHYDARRRDRDSGNSLTDLTPSRRALRRGLAPVYLAIGGVGAYLTFGSVQEYLRYFSRPDARLDAASALDHTLVGAAGTFLRPFLGVAIVLMWSLCVDRRARTTLSALRVRVVTSVAAVLLVLSNASYNRGSMVAPLIALIGAYSLHVRRLRPALLLLVAIPGTAAVLLWGEYRTSTNIEFTELFNSDSLGALYSDSNVGDQLQIYGQGSQFLAFFLEETGFGSQLWYGRTILASLLYPVPILGSYFRADSAATLYNHLIYNDDVTLDQVVPFAGELFLNFHLIGVVIGYWLLGRAVNILQLRFLRSTDAFEAYLWCLVGMWTSFLIIGHLAILSQIYVFFFWPFYLYGIAVLWGRVRWNHLAHRTGFRVAS
jgi:hypothetical protein